MTGPFSSLAIRSSWGSISVAAAEGRLLSCRLPVLGRAPGRNPSFGGHDLKIISAEDRDVLLAASRFIRQLFLGHPVACPPLHEQNGTDFFRRVISALRRIPAGSVMTYGDLARKAGFAGAARAAGTACGANTLPLFIPCHRVIAAGGKPGGFSSGLAWKMHLLRVESTAEGIRACA